MILKRAPHLKSLMPVNQRSRLVSLSRREDDEDDESDGEVDE